MATEEVPGEKSPDAESNIVSTPMLDAWAIAPDESAFRAGAPSHRLPDALAITRVGATYTGDCPDFRGAADVALPVRVFAAKRGLSPSRRGGSVQPGDVLDQD